MSTEPDAGIDEVSRTWTRLGREDPLWAVLTDKDKEGGGWAPADFLATGATEIATLLARLGELGADPARGRAVDFGCGAGRLSHGLATAGFGEVIGLDISPTMLEKAREIVEAPACDFRLATGPDLAVVEPGSADLVYTCRVLQHMPSELAHRYVRAFYRIAKPGGLVVFQLPTAPRWNAAGVALRVLPRPVLRRLRRGMEMHGTTEADVRALVRSAGGEVLAADPDTSAGDRWDSRLYVTRAAAQ
ncbi:class I SAM-dependent methyltransferase [Actinomycetospora flava]|uniref:Class I SAM-dependent methyltransferase n=1 Tax=Actinomycetospora flava TaxID=3129232 RepID=A0ABU8M7N9_9PSEU